MGQVTHHRASAAVSSRHAVQDVSPTTLTFAEDGDTTITVRSGWGSSRSFIVSSAILKHASPVFRAVLTEEDGAHSHSNEHFPSEGPLANFDVRSLTSSPEPQHDLGICSLPDSPESGEIVDITTPTSSQGAEALVLHHKVHLNNNDVHAMEIIFRALHFIDDEIPSSRAMLPKRLLDIATHCETYDCFNAMRGWILHWCGGPYVQYTVEDWGYMLLAAWIFKSCYFGKMMQEAAKSLPPWFPTEWEANPSLARLPQQATDWLKRTIAATFSEIENLFQRGEGHLRSFTYIDEKPPSCRLCRRYLTFDASRCKDCRSYDLDWPECTRDSRIADYFSILRDHRLWPTTKFRRYSLRRFMDAIAALKKETACCCTAESGCSLTLYVRGLPDEVKKVVDGIKEVGEDLMRG